MKLPFDKKKKRLRSLKSLKKEAWELFAKVMRAKGAINGFIRCISCHRQYAVGDRALNAGHYRHGKWTRVSGLYENNVWPQCVFCNCGGGTNGSGQYISELYRERLIDRLGLEEVEKIEHMSKQIWKPTREDLERIIEQYGDKSEGLK